MTEFITLFSAQAKVHPKLHKLQRLLLLREKKIT